MEPGFLHLLRSWGHGWNWTTAPRPGQLSILTSLLHGVLLSLCVAPPGNLSLSGVLCPLLSLTSAHEPPSLQGMGGSCLILSQVLWRDRRDLVCWDQQNPPILSTKHRLWFLSPPSPHPEASDGLLRQFLHPWPIQVS